MAGRELKIEDSWVAYFAEDEWLHGDQDAFKAIVRDTAKVNTCARVRMFVVPDPLFPFGDHKGPYVVHDEVLSSPTTPAYEIKAVFRGYIVADVYNGLSELGRSKLVTKVRDGLNKYSRGAGGSYEIVLKAHDGERVLERGRV